MELPGTTPRSSSRFREASSRAAAQKCSQTFLLTRRNLLKRRVARSGGVQWRSRGIRDCSLPSSHQDTCGSRPVCSKREEGGGDDFAREAMAKPSRHLSSTVSPFESTHLGTASHVQIVAPVSSSSAHAREQGYRLLSRQQRSISADQRLACLPSTYLIVPYTKTSTLHAYLAVEAHVRFVALAGATGDGLLPLSVHYELCLLLERPSSSGLG